MMLIIQCNTLNLYYIIQYYIMIDVILYYPGMLHSCLLAAG